MSSREYTIDLSCHPFVVRMKEQRAAKGYTLRALAQKSGTSSRSYLSELERGSWVVSVELGLSICQVLDIPVHYVFDYIKQGTIQRMEDTFTKEYTKWAEYVPDEVKEQMLSTRECQLIHDTYYDKELVECY